MEFRENNLSIQHAGKGYVIEIKAPKIVIEVLDIVKEFIDDKSTLEKLLQRLKEHKLKNTT